MSIVFLFIPAILVSWKFECGQVQPKTSFLFYLYQIERGWFNIRNKLNTAKGLPYMVGIALGAAVMAASFFILRGQSKNRRDLKNLARRVEELEIDHMLEAYREKGLY
jgi:hypothetical protein